MTQCDCPRINLPIQFKFVFNSTVQFLYITLTPFGHTNWPPDMAVAHKFLFWANPVHAQYFLEQFWSPLLNFCKKLPIIQKLFPNIWPRPNHQHLQQHHHWCMVPDIIAPGSAPGANSASSVYSFAIYSSIIHHAYVCWSGIAVSI